MRKNDRNYKVGDELILTCYPREGSAFAPVMRRVRVTNIIQGGQYGIANDYVVMSIQKEYNNKDLAETISLLQLCTTEYK